MPCPCGPGCKCKDGDCGCGANGICGCGPDSGCAMESCKTRIVLKVDGMACGGCVGGVEKALLAVPGVSSAKVTFANKLAVIEGTAKTPDLVKAVEATGKSAVGCVPSHLHAPGRSRPTHLLRHLRTGAPASAVPAASVWQASAAAPWARAGATQPAANPPSRPPPRLSLAWCTSLSPPRWASQRASSSPRRRSDHLSVRQRARNTRQVVAGWCRQREGGARTATRRLRGARATALPGGRVSARETPRARARGAASSRLRDHQMA